jgi:hypothetical protein
MVRVSYDDLSVYDSIKERAIGRKACSVMILVSTEVDAMASARMLTQLLRQDNIAYTLRPVANYTQVEKNRNAYVTSDIKTIFMINCGAVSD